jgi:hypothetical protein
MHLCMVYAKKTNNISIQKAVMTSYYHLRTFWQHAPTYSAAATVSVNSERKRGK